MKSRMAKIISLILALVLVTVSGACLQSFAANDDFEEVIEQTYSQTIQDLLHGEEVEFTYDGHPMTYDLATIDAMIDSNKAGTLFSDVESGAFDSGRDAGGYPTHQRICANALAILLHDKGTSVFDTLYAFEDGDSFVDSTHGTLYKTYADYIVYHSASPDENERGTYEGLDENGKTTYSYGASDILSSFYGHFYDPYTEKNWKDSTGETCKNNARRHYDVAVSLYRAGRTVDAFEELGRGSHYVQDACQTQHANNLTAIADGYLNGLNDEANRHAKFEKDVDVYIRNHMPFTNKLANTSQNVFDESVYNEALQLSVENIVRNNDYSSYVLIDKSDYRYMLDKDNYNVYIYNKDYYDSATAQFKNATMATVQYLYHFANEVGITFSK